MLILLLLNVIILPVAISFFNDNWSHTGLLIFNLVSDSMFLLDIGVNFRTGLFRIFYIFYKISVELETLKLFLQLIELKELKLAEFGGFNMIP